MPVNPHHQGSEDEKVGLRQIIKDGGCIAGPARAGFTNFITALTKETPIIIRREKECAQAFPKFMIASPSFHGGRGALPSAGGHPADLTFLAGGIRIPIYLFGTESLMDNGFCEGPSYIPEEDQSMLDLLLLAQWEDRMWKGLFRYDVTTSEIKLIGGRRKFLAQLNEQWNKDYLTEPNNNKVCYQGDPFIFNWMKHHEELLFCAASGEKADPELIPAAAVPHGAIFVILNASPVEYGHVFLVPGGFNSIYAFLDARSLEMVMRFAVEINNSSFRLFYECSTPSASHIYFQACYFPNPLPVELMPVVTFFSEGQGGVQICGVTDYPIKAFMFTSNGNLKVLVQLLAEICYCLREKNISYNLLISDSSKKIFLFPLLQTLANSCTLSAWECGGYFLFKSGCDFDQASEEAMLKCLGAVSLDDEGFQIVKQLCCRVASQLAS